MALNSDTKYNTPQQMLNIAKGLNTNSANLRKQYGIKDQSPKINQYKNVNSVKPTNQQPSGNLGVGTKVGNLGVVTTKYMGSTRYEPNGTHPGIDIANKAGTDIPAFTNGIVTAASGGHKHGEKGFGNYVVVQDGKGNYHRYSHLQGGYLPVLNSKVTKGQILGKMGATGSTYSTSNDPKRKGEHLDYRVYDGNKKALDPFAYIMTNYYNTIR